MSTEDTFLASSNHNAVQIFVFKTSNFYLNSIACFEWILVAIMLNCFRGRLNVTFLLPVLINFLETPKITWSQR